MTYVPSIFAPPEDGSNSNSNTYQPQPSSFAPSSSFQQQSSYVPSSNYQTYSSNTTSQPTYTATSNSSTLPFSQALNNPVPSYTSPTPPAYNPAATTASVTPAYKQTRTDTEYKPAVTAYPVVAAPSQYQHGNGPTHGVVHSTSNPVQCHKLDYEIKGSEMQLVEVLLDPGETVIAEAGAMMYLEDNIDFKAKFGDGSNTSQGFFGKLMAAGGRIMTGESLFVTHFTNNSSNEVRRVAFAAPYPGTILPIDMQVLQKQYLAHGDKQTSLICQKDAFLCAAFGTKLSMHFHKKLGSGLFGGEGFILEKLKGDGMVFLHAGGCVIKKELKRGQRLRVDTGCLVGFTSPGIDYNITMVPGLKSMFFGGEGLFLATLEGEGTVWLQSLPFSRLADRVIQNAPSVGGRRTGEGSRLTGGFGDLIDGDGFSGFR